MTTHAPNIKIYIFKHLIKIFYVLTFGNQVTPEITDSIYSQTSPQSGLVLAAQGMQCSGPVKTPRNSST